MAAGKDLSGPSNGEIKAIASLLIAREVVTEEALNEAMKRQRGAKRPLVEILVEQGAADESALMEVLAEKSRVNLIIDGHLDPDPDIQDLVPVEFGQRYGILPLRVEGDVLHVATCDPFQLEAFDELTARTEYRIRRVLAPPSAIRAAAAAMREDEIVLGDVLRNQIEQDADLSFESLEEDSSTDQLDVDVFDSESPIVRFVNFVLADGIRQKASDIHIESEEDSVRIRFRIDGDLHDMQNLPSAIRPAVLSRLKIVAGLNIIETRQPQDGRARVHMDGGSYDLRVSTMPSYFGEKAVIRVLDPASAVLDLDSCGFEPDVLEQWRGLLHRPNGLLLMTGPTGSGKTSSLYGSLLEIRSPLRNIVTVEDPVEFQFPGIVQVPVRTNIGMTFAKALRSILRQDPDVVLIGEIRDAETAEVAVQAAHTGHLVLSTLHTNDAVSAIPRMLNFGVEPTLLASCMLGVMAQRLVRTICDDCGEPFEWPADEMWPLGGVRRDDEPDGGRYGQGCAKCRGVGMRGRTALTELLVATDDVKALILDGADTPEISALARKNGMRTLAESGRLRVLKGATTPEEVLKVAAPSDDEHATGSTPAEADAVDAVETPVATVDSDKTPCSGCAELLQPDWKLCPFCGVEVLRETETKVVTAVIADDQALQRKIISAALSEMDLEVVEAADGEECLDVIARVRPDILVVDQVMPGRTGVEVIRELRSHVETVALPILMLTGSSDEAMESISLDAGADDYMTKPVVPERLRARISALLRAGKLRKTGS